MPRERMRKADAWLSRHVPHVAVASAALGLALAGASSRAGIAVAGTLVAVAAAGLAPRAALVAGGLVVLGLVAGTARIGEIERPARALGESFEGTVQLQEALRPGPFGWSGEVRAVSGSARGVRLLARFPRPLEIADGDGPGVELGVAGRFRPLDPEAGGFASYLCGRAISGELEVERARLTGRRRGGPEGSVDAIRRRSDRALVAGLSPVGAALARGMVLGADGGIPVSVRDDFRDSGLAHLLAVSGQNVVLLCALALPLLTAAGMGQAVRLPALAALIALYVPLAGAGPSIVRAGVMGVAALAAIALARPASRLHSLGLAACVTLAMNPRAWGDPGWQLSFAAVAGILVLAPKVARRLTALPRPVADAVALTVSATVATAPLLAHHFGAVSTSGLIANVVALPLVAPCMWLGMLRAALGQGEAAGGVLGDLASVANGGLGELLEPLLMGLCDLAALFADLPGGQIDLALGGPLQVVAAYAVLATAICGAARLVRRHDSWGATALAYLRRLPRTRRLGLTLTAALALGLAVARGLAPPGPPAELTVSFLDVGQGDATLIQHPDGSAVLFDGGPPEGGVLRLLRRAGVRRLSVLVMTHASRDHHGGLADVAGRLPIDLLVDGGDGTRDPAFRAAVERAAAHGARVVKGNAPLALDVGAMRIEVLSPSPRPAGPPPEDPNPRAVVAVVSSGGFDLLLSGDAESETLLALALPDVEAMKVPHHGSADPGLTEVLARARPEVASIPVGPNDYGHPAPSTLDALREARVATWRNDRNGTVRVTVGSGAVSVEADRGEPVPPAP